MGAAAAASVPAALLAHLLDVTGRLPMVHESVGVRAAMGPLAVVAWLLLTALLVALAAATRPVLFGALAAMVSAGLPELLGRHDIGAVFEPGAVAGALVQWLLLLTVIGLALVTGRLLRLSPVEPSPRPQWLLAVPTPRLAVPACRPPWRLRSRAPPACPSR